jgi:hypothetical protein
VPTDDGSPFAVLAATHYAGTAEPPIKIIESAEGVTVSFEPAFVERIAKQIAEKLKSK